MKNEHRRTAVGVLAGLTALLLAAPPPSAAVRVLSVGGTRADPTGPLVAAVALLAWTLLAWLALTVAVVLLSRLPGLVGGLARSLARRVAPAAVRRAVEAALGLSVLAGALAPTAALAVPSAVPVAAPSPTGVDGSDATAWDLDWPGSTAASAEVSRPPTAAPLPAAPAARPAPTPPTSAPASTGARASTGPPAVTSFAEPAAPAPRAEPPRGQPSPTAPAVDTLVVRAGDSLWSLAEASLRSAGAVPSDRQVAQAWPRWWAANREAIGEDPDLLLPGTVLRLPAASPDQP